MRKPAIKKGTAKKRIGLFGGTFNPIHLGHLRGAEEIREIFQLDQIIFIPSSIPPHKMSGEILKAEDRLEMVRLAISHNPHFSVSDIELLRPGRSYTIDTLRYFNEKDPDHFFFIMGRDAFVEIETWKEFQNLFALCDFIIMTRPGSQKESASSALLPQVLISDFKYDPQEDTYIHVSGYRLYFKEISFLDISSTKVRELIEKGKSVRYLIPQEVEGYIERHRLYRKNNL